GRVSPWHRPELRGARRRRVGRRRYRARAGRRADPGPRLRAPGGSVVSIARAVRRERTPDRPGPGELRDAHLRRLDLTVRRRVDALLAGDHRATTIGDGSELARIRPYAVGDDVRKIDWNVTARTGEAHLRAPPPD